MFAIHRGWLLATAGLMLLFGAVYYWRNQIPLFANERFSIYTFGLLGFALILFLSNYASRKYIFLWFGGRLRLWLLAHIYLSLLAGFLILLHSRFSFGSPWSGGTATLLWLMIFTGLIGLIIYTAIPRALVDFDSILLPTELRQSVDASMARLQQLASNKPELGSLVAQEQAAKSDLDMSKWKLLFSPSHRSRYSSRKLGEVEALLEGLPGVGADVARTVLEKRKLEAQFLEQQRWTMIRRAWLIAHGSLTASFLTTSVIHIIVVLYY
jgi:hypothetical protein